MEYIAEIIFHDGGHYACTWTQTYLHSCSLCLRKVQQKKGANNSYVNKFICMYNCTWIPTVDMNMNKVMNMHML